jgi:uncharacterized membrane protein YhhN
MGLLRQAVHYVVSVAVLAVTWPTGSLRLFVPIFAYLGGILAWAKIAKNSWRISPAHK